MPARRKAAAVAVGLTPLALTALSAVPAAAHGSLGDPVSRVAQCYAEGPENPRSDACRAAVAAGGTQALYDWNGVRIGDANGRHQELIPDGRLCSANDAEFKGLDLARADWPATSVRGGSYTFEYRVTAPHKGTFTVYLTKAGYDPAQPLAWADLDLEHPVATATDPVASGGFYTFSGTLPARSGRQLLYAIWQRSDSPEAFYSCSDVTFGDGSGAAPAASAPSEEQIQDGADRSTIEHHGHGDDDAATTTDPTASPSAAPATDSSSTDSSSAATAAPVAADDDRRTAVGSGAGSSSSSGEDLAETGGDAGVPYLAVGGATVLALGAALLFASVRRRAAGPHRPGRRAGTGAPNRAPATNDSGA
ncbi:lytic polysaccharide monooxygenase [Streptomyces sp. NBC_01275]|uniref:lytic polysaccharide monooxygenase auxiliary activity family 9 protein n=1 Tax=Streptomyces sp. NBC_01275 TaxID=2903807 RepID=UPI002250E27B|nr:lytic polysaccharide monooxygenase [Streptomyces sp. NBC_01275]MCX4760899.1 lytic polysaccharide monooxygenase [Streptomyces sp. NBC_01275]